MKKVISVFLFPLLCFSQKTNVIKIKDAKMDNLLEIPSYDCEHEFKIIRNDNYAIYQDANHWKKYYPDMKTLNRFNRNGSKEFEYDKNTIFYKSVQMDTDTTNFEILGIRGSGNDYVKLWKTNKGVYKGTEKLKFNPKYFNLLKPYSYYTYDDKNVYYKENKIDVDPKTITSYGAYLVWDAKNSYLNGKKVMYKGEKIEQINAKFYKTSKFILTLDRGEFKEFSANVNSFKVLSKNYAMSTDTVYYQADAIPIKKENFKYLKTWEGSSYIYITDNEKVYFKSGFDIRENLDAKTFGVYEDSEIYYDKNGIYYREYDRSSDAIVDVKLPFKYTVPVSTENSFVIGNYPMKVVYNNQIYQGEIVYSVTKEEIEQAKKGNLIFEKIDGKKVDKIFSYSVKKAGDKIYCNKNETNANAKTFKKIFRYVYSDAKNVYVATDDGLSILEGVDPESMEGFNSFYKDKNYLYSGKIKIISSKNIELLGVFKGYRMQCSQDSSPASDYYVFKNKEGYWLVRVSREISVKKLGKKLPKKLQIEIDKKFNWKSKE